MCAPKGVCLCSRHSTGLLCIVFWSWLEVKGRTKSGGGKRKGAASTLQNCRELPQIPDAQHWLRDSGECQASLALMEVSQREWEEWEVNVKKEIAKNNVWDPICWQVVAICFHRTKQSFQIWIGYIRCLNFMEHWNIEKSSSMKCSSSIGGLDASLSLQGLAILWKTKFIWNCLMHYLSNNQGSKFILQIIIAFVVLMAKISQSSEPLTGCAFSGKCQLWVCNAKCPVRDLAAS